MGLLDPSGGRCGAGKVGEVLESSDILDGIDLSGGLLEAIFGGAADDGADSDWDDYSMEVPPSVLALTEEEDALLNGELKDGVYVNEYFGLRLTIPEGGTLVRDIDGATESTEIIPLRRAYEEGWGGLSFSATVEGIDGDIFVIIKALEEDEVGLSEKDLVQKNIDELWEINALFGEDRGPTPGAALLAGEEHPAAFQTSEIGSGEQRSVDFYIPKGDFACFIFIYANNAEPDVLTACFDKP